MPEGHTVHALSRRLERAFGGADVSASSPQGRFAAEAARLDGHPLERATARGKHLFVEMGPETLHVHLGLIGTFPVRPVEGCAPPEPAVTVRLRLATEAAVADLRGPMVCTLVDVERRREIEQSLGPDPLDPAANSELARARVRRSGKSIAELLMDQATVAGVGNVYRCEVLHRQAVDPLTPGRDLSDGAWDDLWSDLRLLMPLGVAFSQILTMDDQVREAAAMVADGSADAITAGLTGERLGDFFERRFHTYQRAGTACDRCSNPLQDKQIAGRTLYWCSACQLRR